MSIFEWLQLTATAMIYICHFWNSRENKNWCESKLRLFTRWWNQSSWIDIKARNEWINDANSRLCCCVWFRFELRHEKSDFFFYSTRPFVARLEVRRVKLLKVSWRIVVKNAWTWTFFSALKLIKVQPCFYSTSILRCLLFLPLNLRQKSRAS